MRVAFPFDSLLRHIEGRISEADSETLSLVLVPRGRSLQRAAAAPTQAPA